MFVKNVSFGLLTGIGLLMTVNIASASEIDLRKRSRFSDQINHFLRNLAQGNERSSGIDRLTLNTQTGQIRGEVWIRSRQVSGHTPKVFNPFSGRHVGGAPIVAYDWTVRGNFSFNPKNGAGHATIDLGRGIRFDTRRIQRILEGDHKAIPELVPNLGVVQKKMRNEYDHIRGSIEARHGHGNVYFASRAFVDWATPETAGEWVLKAVVAGGPAAGAVAMKEASRKARQEMSRLVPWLERKGVRDAHSMANAILTGQRVDWPNVSIHWQTVGYFSSNYVGGQRIGPEVRVTHAAFYIVWKGGSPR